MILPKKIAQQSDKESFFQQQFNSHFDSSAGAQFNFCLFWLNIETWTIDCSFSIQYFTFNFEFSSTLFGKAFCIVS